MNPNVSASGEAFRLVVKTTGGAKFLLCLLQESLICRAVCVAIFVALCFACQSQCHAQQTIPPASLSEWLLSTKHQDRTISPLGAEGDLASEAPAASGETVSDRITPLPAQGELFGRLKGVQAKLPNDDFAMYGSADKQPQGGVRGLYHTHLPTEGMPLWSGDVYTWAAPNLYHQPLYFEEVNLERYGVGPRRIFHAPISTAHFFTNVAILPYHLGSMPPRTRVYTLGHYRGGDRIPFHYHRLPFSVKGLAAQAAATAGIVIIP